MLPARLTNSSDPISAIALSQAISPESAFSTRRGSPAVAGIRRHAAREKPSPSIGSNLSQADTPAGRFDSLIRIKAG